MVDSALLSDVAAPRGDQKPSPRTGSSSPGNDAFEKVRAEVSKAGRPQQSPKPEPTDQAREEPAAKPPAGPQQPTGKKRSDAADEENSTTLAESSSEGTGELESTEAIGFLSPTGAPTTGGSELPVLAGEMGSSSSNLRQVFLQLARGEGAAGKPGAAVNGLAGKALGMLDSQGFKATLAEAVDAKAGINTETTGTTVMTSARGVEIREGSALIRQYSTTVDTPVQQHDWGDKMAGKISWLANQRISFAEIHINPPDMGPIDVKVNVQNDQASVAVHSQNPSVRDLLELNSHRLRDMLQENGMELAQMDVSDQPANPDQDEEGEAPGGSQSKDGDQESGLVSHDGEPVATGEVHLQWQSQVDTYA